MNISKTIENKSDEDKEEESHSLIFMNWWVDLISYILISTVVIGSYNVYLVIDDRIADLKLLNPSYSFPKYSDLLPAIYYLITLIIFHKLFLIFTTESIKKNLTPKYLDTGSEITAEIYKKKVSTTIYKGFFFLFSTIFGYCIMRNFKFFPKTLFGDGHIKNLFELGYPDVFYFSKPNYFDMYYNLNLAFALFDGWILITNPFQSDFLFMILHHLITYSLIIFSYASNYSSVGAIIYFIHYSGDIFSCIVRSVIHLNVSERIPFVSTFVFLVVFTYTRVYVFGDVIYQFINTYYKWNAIEFCLGFFVIILMMLNILWIVLISIKFIRYCFTGNIEEIYKIKIVKDKNKLKST